MGKQNDLPGMGDRKLQDLHDAAERYCDIRDKRMALTPKEADLKQELLTLMHKHKKEVYTHGDLTIEVVTEEETVKVKIKKPKEEEAA